LQRHVRPAMSIVKQEVEDFSEFPRKIVPELPNVSPLSLDRPIFHTAALITSHPLAYECDCGDVFSNYDDARRHVQDSVEYPSYDKLIEGSVKEAVKYAERFPDWYMTCHDTKYRSRVQDICREVFVNLRPWAFRKWWCVNITTGLGGCYPCFIRDCKTCPGVGTGQRDKAKQLRMNAAGLQYVSTMSHEQIRQHQKNMAIFFPGYDPCEDDEDAPPRPAPNPNALPAHLFELGPNFDPKALNTPEEIPFDHKFIFDPCQGIYVCTCKMKFEEHSEAVLHCEDANVKPSIEEFLTGDVRQGLKYACKFPEWYIPAEKVEVRQRVHDIIDTFQTKSKRLPIMQHSWACYNLYQQVFGCVKCYEHCKENSRCFGNITKRQASIEKARGNTFKLHCDTATHQRLHFTTIDDSDADSDCDEVEYTEGEAIILTGGYPEDISYHDCIWNGREWQCDCGKLFDRYKTAKKHVENNVSWDPAPIMQENCAKVQQIMAGYKDMYLNMGFDDKATQMCYLIKKFKYRQNYRRFWWASMNFANRTIGCSICWEFHKGQTANPLINKTLSMDACNVPSLNQHEKSTCHQSLLTSLNFRKRNVTEKIEIHKRKKRRLCAGYKTGTCVVCGWATEVEINISESHPCKLAVTNIIKGSADQLLMSHVMENCSRDIRNTELAKQIRQFQRPVRMGILQKIWPGRSSLVWENLEREKDLPIAKSPKKEMNKLFTLGSPQKTKQELRTPSPLSPDSSDSEETCRRRVPRRGRITNRDVSRSRSRSPLIFRGGKGPRIRTKRERMSYDSDDKKSLSPGQSSTYANLRLPQNGLQMHMRDDPEEPVQRVKENYEPDCRWMQLGALYVCLKTSWGYANLWMKPRVQKAMDSMGFDVSVLVRAHRVIVEGISGKLQGSMWKELKELAATQCREWMNSPHAVPQWVNHTISVLWKNDKTWNKGYVKDIDDNEITVTYVSDYSEGLAVNYDLTFRFEKFEMEEWWRGRTIDLRQDRWREAVIEELVGNNKARIRYLGTITSQTTETIDLSENLFYFTSDRITDTYEQTRNVFNLLQKPPSIAIPLHSQNIPNPLSNPAACKDVAVKKEEPDYFSSNSFDAEPPKPKRRGRKRKNKNPDPDYI